MTKVNWKDKPDKHDYEAAEHYMSLLLLAMTPALTRGKLQQAAKEGLVYYQAKDILRASGLPLLPEDNKHVAADLAKIKDGEELSPVLLVRGNPLTIADGYHRVVASYWTDENTEIPAALA